MTEQSNGQATGTQAALSMAAVFPTGAMAGAVEFVSAVLGIAPTFVDGDRWAQFDLNGGRLSLASGAESSGSPQVMVKVADLDGVCGRLRGAGFDVGGPVTGPHERRVSVTGPDGWGAVLYEPLPR
jgi:hypothetical protein